MRLLMIFALSGCTINTSMVHNQGQSTDLMDTTTTPTTDVSPELSIPLKG